MQTRPGFCLPVRKIKELIEQNWTWRCLVFCTQKNPAGVERPKCFLYSLCKMLQCNRFFPLKNVVFLRFFSTSFRLFYLDPYPHCDGNEPLFWPIFYSFMFPQLFYFQCDIFRIWDHPKKVDIIIVITIAIIATLLLLSLLLLLLPLLLS